jgi:hypothetical protein
VGRVAVDAISFPIALATELTEGAVHYIPVSGLAPAGCTGGTASEPTADPGNLCVYAVREANAVATPGIVERRIENAGGTDGVSPDGAVVVFDVTANSVEGEEDAIDDAGTWAVTAP